MKRFLVSIISAGLAVCCSLANKLIGTRVDVDGILKEPFYLIPFTYIFGLITVVSFIYVILFKPKGLSLIHI